MYCLSIKTKESFFLSFSFFRNLLVRNSVLGFGFCPVNVGELAGGGYVAVTVGVSHLSCVMSSTLLLCWTFFAGSFGYEL